MNIKFQTMNPSYRAPMPSQGKRTAKPEKARGNYDTVTIHKAYSAQENDEGFARVLARRAASQIGAGAAPERVQELKSQVADGTYQPDAQKIAGRLLGLI